MAEREIKEIIIHCSATGPDMDIGVYEIDRWHRAQGWLSCGYHYVIRRDGRLEKGRPEEEPGAHCRGRNLTSIGICLAGGLGGDGRAEANYTEAQWKRLRELVYGLREKYPKAAIKGHNDFTAGKTCPNFSVGDWWKRQIN